MGSNLRFGARIRDLGLDGSIFELEIGRIYMCLADKRSRFGERVVGDGRPWSAMVGPGGICGGQSMIRILTNLKKSELESSTPLPFGWADLIASRIPPGLGSEALGSRLEAPGLKARQIIDTTENQVVLSGQALRHSSTSRKLGLDGHIWCFSDTF